MGVSTRLRALVNAVNPRALHRTQARVDQMHEQARLLQETVALLDIRTQQLLTIQRENRERRGELADALALLDRDRVLTHVRAAIESAELRTDPFPHCLVREWLPPDVYDLMMRALPASLFFADRPRLRQQIPVPPLVAPELSQVVWEFISREVVTEAVGPALDTKFATHLDAYLASLTPGAPDWRSHVPMHSSDGRILLRRPGYVIEPHRDPGWGFLTCLAYLARPGDNKEWGTQLYRVREDAKAPDETAYYVPTDRCELVRSVPFRRNTMLVFINGSGAHGASIPADAQPPDLERYLYQFRFGPTPEGIRWLLDHMPPAERALWAGLKTSRVTGY